MRRVKLFAQMLAEAGRDWGADKAPRLGAALAYYSVFSLAPLLLIAIGLAGLVFGEQAARGEILGQIRSTVGDTAAAAIEEILRQSSRRESGLLATAVGLVILFFGASGVFVELQDALNTIWKVMPRPGLGWRDLIRVRLLSFSLILGTGFLLLVSLVVSAALQALNDLVEPAAAHVPGGASLWVVVNTALSFALVALLFAMIYRILPDADIGWRDVWLGAVVAALLFTAGKYAIGLYLGRGTLTSTFGAAGSVIVVLTWVYYSSQILLYGAELTRVYARRTGSHVRPAGHAVPVTAEALASQGIRCPPDAGENAQGP